MHNCCKVAGETEAIEYIVQPVTNGFQKRFSVAFMPEPSSHQDHDFAEEASKYVESMHSWMFRYAIDAPGEHFLDGYAQSAYRAVLMGVNDWLQSTEGRRMEEYAKAKLRFWSTDVLRLAHANMRVCQCALSEYTNVCEEEVSRTAPNAYEFLMAVRMWMRQMHLHLTFYRWFGKLLGETRDGPGHQLGGMRQKEADPESEDQKKDALDITSKLKHELLRCPSFRPGVVLPLSSMRLLLRNKAIYTQNFLTRGHIDNCVKDLVSCGLLKTTTLSDDAEGRPAKKGKRTRKIGKVHAYIKASLEEVEASDSAKKEKIRLCVADSCF
jgi:hypothetical protein